MTDTPNADEGATATNPLRGQRLVLPGEPEGAKLPLPRVDSTVAAALPEELKAAWTQYMVTGFKQNEQMF